MDSESSSWCSRLGVTGSARPEMLGDARQIVSNALYGPVPPDMYHVIVEAVTVASSEQEARQRVSRWLGEGRPGVHGWVNIRLQSEELPP